MAILKFKARVCGSSPRDDGRFALIVQEQGLSDDVKFYVRDLAKNFDPKAARSYKARNTPCPYVPGLGYYSFPIEADRIGRYAFGSVVDVELEVSMIHHVNYSETNSRWFPKNELRYDLVKLGSSSDKSSSQSPDEAVPGAKAGK